MLNLLKMQEPGICVTDKSIPELVRALSSNPNQGDDPFFVADLGDIISKYFTWKRQLPRIQPFYAVKSCPEPVVVELLEMLGVNFDCASKGEIEAITKLSGVVPSERIIYANPCKTMSYIKYAAKKNVDLMTFDNVSELHKVKKHHPNARMVLRLKVENKECVSELSLKFGATLRDVPELLQTAKDLDINIVGVSFHVGSGCSDLDAFNRAIADSDWTFRQAEKYGFKPSLLDIGGGFPGDSTSPIKFEDVAKVIRRALDKYFPVNRGVDIIAEPGRFFVSSAFTLCANVIAKRSPTVELCDSKINQYYINDGVYGALNCVLFENRKLTPYALDSKSGEKLFKSIVWGPTCDSVDMVVDNCYLPVMDVGDWMVFENVGAYTICAASHFNGFEPPAIHFVISSFYRTIMMKIKAKVEMNDLNMDRFENFKKSIDSTIQSSPQYIAT